MKNIFIACFFFVYSSLCAQNDRLNDHNYINWVQTFNTIRLDSQWSLHAEYQWRRDHGLRNWQQSLLRLGVNFKLHENVTAHLGYAWIETFPYGDYPIAANGTFSEHRIYEQLNMRQTAKKFLFTHRFRIEQRWLERMVSGVNGWIKDWYFLHRFRYQFKSQYKLWSKNNQQLYAAAADEIFIGAGKSASVNIFDQNRLFLLMGYAINKRITLEAGYMNQTLQQSRRVNDRTIMQRNNGVVISSYINW